MSYISHAESLGVKFSVNGAVSLPEILKSIGARIVYKKDQLTSGLVSDMSYDNNGLVISLNPCFSNYEPRINYVIAINIGHHFIHSQGSGGNCLFNYTEKSLRPGFVYWNKMLSEARTFALAMLMPLELLIDQCNSYLEDTKSSNKDEFILYLMNKLNVSKTDLLDRLAYTGIIDLR